jgi:mannose-1-phosphate guanylyltransferase
VGGVKILPVIMCGGSGTRMWPESRESLPKQFIPLIGERSTFQTIVGVVSDPAIFDPAVVITNYEYRFRVAEQLREIGAEAEILLEPDRRDSAAAVGAAAAWAAARDPKTVVAVLAADHVFEDGKHDRELFFTFKALWRKHVPHRIDIDRQRAGTRTAQDHLSDPQLLSADLRRLVSRIDE